MNRFRIIDKVSIYLLDSNKISLRLLTAQDNHLKLEIGKMVMILVTFYSLSKFFNRTLSIYLVFIEVEFLFKIKNLVGAFHKHKLKKIVTIYSPVSGPRTFPNSYYKVKKLILQ